MSSVSGESVITLPVTSTPHSVTEGTSATVLSVYVAEEQVALSPDSISKLAATSAAKVKSELKVRMMVSPPPV